MVWFGRYEKGGPVAARSWSAALAALAATSGSASAAGFESSALNHVSIVVGDLQRFGRILPARPFGLRLQKRKQGGAIGSAFKLGKSHPLDPGRGDGPKGVDHFRDRARTFRQGFGDCRFDGAPAPHPARNPPVSDFTCWTRTVSRSS